MITNIDANLVNSRPLNETDATSKPDTIANENPAWSMIGNEASEFFISVIIIVILRLSLSVQIINFSNGRGTGIPISENHPSSAPVK